MCVLAASRKNKRIWESITMCLCLVLCVCKNNNNDDENVEENWKNFHIYVCVFNDDDMTRQRLCRKD